MVTDSIGGGVLILVNDTLIATELKQFKTDCEIVWVKLNIVGAKPLYIAAYYRPRVGDAQSAEEFAKSLALVSKMKGNFWILRDFNYPKFT